MDLLVCYACPICGHEHYFDRESLPGGAEHCEFCEECCGKLTETET